jgi:hypothetical protein
MDAGRRERITFASMAVLLVIRFIARLTPDSDTPSSTLTALTVFLDLCLVIGFVGLGPRVLRSLPEGASRGGWIFLLVVGTVATLGMVFGLLPGGPRLDFRRYSTTKSDPKMTVPMSEVPVKEMHDLLASVNKVPKGPPTPSEVMSQRLHELIAAWIVASDKYDKRTSVKKRVADRKEIHEILGEIAETRECVAKILQLFAEAEANRLDLSSAWNERALTWVEYWRAMKQTLDASYERLGLAEQHYEEWDPNAAPGPGSKPWEREIQRLEQVALAGVKDMQDVLAAAAASPTPPGLLDFVNLSNGKEKLRSELAAYRETLASYNQTRWAQAPADKAYRPEKITSADLHQCGELLARVLASMDRLIAAFDSSHSILRFEEKEYWRVRREICSLTVEQIKVLETNWKEWHAAGLKADASEAKPWQKETTRLQEEIDKHERMLVLHRSHTSKLLE